MANFYLVPIVKNTIDKIIYRDPAFVKGRVSSGLDTPYSFFDFGHKSDYGVLVCDSIITDKDAYLINTTGAIVQNKKDDFKAVLKKAKLDDVWTSEGADWREVVHRLLGLSQAMQSAEDDPRKPTGEDDPSKWLGRFIHAGKVSFAPINMAAFEAEQQTVKASKELFVQDFVRQAKSGKLDWASIAKKIILSPLMLFALPASDTFTAADGTLLTTYSANWVNNRQTFKISSNRAGCAGSGEGMCHWGADTFANDQYAQATLTSLGTSGNWIGVSVRCNTSTADGYGLYVATSSGQSDYVYKLVSGTATTIDSAAGSYAVNDVVRLEVTSTTLTPKKNGSTHAMGTSTDSSFSAGYAGLAGYNNAYTTNNLDTWSAGNLGATDYPITAEQASFTLTGNASSLINARKITADQASFTETGNAAGLTASRAIIAGQASFTLTGQASGLTTARTIAAAQTSYTLTGQAAGVTTARKITADQTSYTLTGYDATLTHASLGSYTLTADYSAFTVTAFDAGFAASHKLTADNVSYAITGYDANFNLTRSISAQYSTFTFTGYAAGIIYTGSAFDFGIVEITADGYYPKASARQAIQADNRSGIRVSRTSILADSDKDIQVK
jgi:hypothetical protein